MAKFRISSPATPQPDSPALLFRDLPRDPSIKFLWDHQAKLLENYHAEHLQSRDLAIELPTGSGKTLVALLIAEYWRRAFGERVAFLCPTRQLCSQVAGQTGRYGLRSSLLVGPQKDYDRADFLAYQQAKAIGITTYSGVFNANPAIDDAQLLICDDAHAAENYVSNLWTVSLNRHEEEAAFLALFAVLRSALPENVIHRIENYDPSRRANLVDLISPISVFETYPKMRTVLNDLGDGASWGYAWRTISDHLDACSLYCSAEAFEIRPVISPALTHQAFAGAKQRIYMSATLGEDGDIERSFGVTRIARLPIPQGWDKRGTGRRLVLFPGYGVDDEQAWITATKMLRQTGRALILVPDDQLKNRVREIFATHFPVLEAKDIERSMQPFTSSPGCPVLIVANRWEGIDLPGDDCRLLILVGLPAGSGLQERFLMERLGAASLLRDRIRTRVTQAMGRCTRDEADFAIVLMLRTDLLKWCCTGTNLDGIHPEIQAELQFGLDNSEDRSPEELAELTQDFLAKSEDWRAAEAAIIERRNLLSRKVDKTARELSQAAPSEIEFVYRLWNAEFDSALESANKALHALAGGDDLKPYRSFWHHQTAIAAFFAFRATGKEAYKTIATQHLESASTTSLGIRSLGEVRAKLMGVPAAEESILLPVREWLQNLNALLTTWGIRGNKFEKQVSEVRDWLKKTDDAKSFERGLSLLGQMLGAKTHRWEEDGAPDGFWLFEEWHSFVFEAKQEKGKAISLKTVRQARTHEERARQDGLLSPGIECTTVVASDQVFLDPFAQPHSFDLRRLTPTQVLDIFERATRALREVRTLAAVTSEEELQTESERIYRSESVFFAQITTDLRAHKLGELPIGR